MKTKFGKQFILIPVGLFLLSSALLLSQRNNIPDLVKGLFFGISIGMMLIPFVLTIFKHRSS